jgi:hypothetical protein
MRTLLTTLALALLIAPPFDARGQTTGQAAPTSQPSWGCWVSDPEGRFQVHFLRCVAMSERLPASPSRRVKPDWQALEQVRRLIAEGDVARIEAALDSAAFRLPRGSLWQIRIGGYPEEDDWSTGRPAQLARALLCSDPVTCSVFIRH